jgi:hypothetical protein
MVAAQIGLGRAEGGRAMAMASRYMGLTTPFWVAVAGLVGLVALHRRALRRRVHAALLVLGLSLAASSLLSWDTFRERWRGLWPALAEAHLPRAPDRVLAAFHPEVHQVRDGLPVLERLRLSFFREGFVRPPVPGRLPVFDQVLAVKPPVPRFSAGRVSRPRVIVANPGPASWSALGRGSMTMERAVRLSYRWLARDGAVVVEDGERTELPRDLPPGGRVELRAVVRAPDAPGRYTLRLSLVQEGVAWFDARGARPLDLVVDVGS